MTIPGQTGTASYDEVLYPSYVFPQTSPERLAAEAIFRGLDPPAPMRCRYLEIGCGNGANLLLHASNFPDAEFVGIDLGSEHIRQGKSFQEELGLSNVRLEQMDVMDPKATGFGTFDYVIAHGLYSWIPDAVRDRVDDVFAASLAPNGVGYISYNVYPGCHVREMLWNMLRYHSRDASSPSEKLKVAGEFLSIFREGVVHPQFKEMIGQEIETFEGRKAENIFHDDLSGINRPFYFYEFAKRMEAAGLQYLCELPAMAVSDIDHSPEESASIAKLGPKDLIEREQYSDFIQMQRFRSSLVCRADRNIVREPTTNALRYLRFFTDVRPASETPDVRSHRPENFVTTTNRGFSVDHPMVKAALVTMSGKYPGTFSFDELVEASAARLGIEINDEDVNTLGNFILRFAAVGPILYRLQDPPLTKQVSERPLAAPFTRWQAVNGSNSLTTAAGYNIHPNNPAVLFLVSLLDGTRDLPELIAAMDNQYDVPESARERLKAELTGVISAQLEQLAEYGILIG